MCPAARSELDPAEAAALDPATGELRFGWSNVCMHWFRRDFLQRAAQRLRDEAVYHIAKKQIPSLNGTVPVSKLTQQLTRWEVVL